MSMIESIRRYIADKCPFLDDEGRIGINYLSENSLEYSVNEVPASSLRKRYVDGGGEYQKIFHFTCRMPYGDSIGTNEKSSAFFEQFYEWLERQTQAGDFPEIEAGEPFAIQATTGGYIAEAGPDTAEYVIQCVLLYAKG